MGVNLGADVKIGKASTVTMKVGQAVSRPTENPPNSQPAFEAKRTVAFVGLKFEF